MNPQETMIENQEPIDLTESVLSLCRNKTHMRLLKDVADRSLAPQAVKVLEAYEIYFQDHKEEQFIDGQAFEIWFGLHMMGNKSFDPESVLHLHRLTEQTQSLVSYDALFDQLLRLRTARAVNAAVAQFEEGISLDIAGNLRAIIDKHNAEEKKTADASLVKLDINAIFENQKETSGYSFPWPEFNSIFKPMRPGKSYLFGARVDKGKSTWVCAMAVHLARQLQEGECVAIFNNEGFGLELYQRLIQAALGITVEEMVAMGRDACLQQYALSIGGINKIKVFDIHGRSSADIEQMIAKSIDRVAAALYDMLDNVSYSDGNGGQRTDEKLEGLYKWQREVSVRHNLVSIVATQLSADAEGVKFPPQTMMKDSKTGKQGACDVIIFMGTSTAAGEEEDRFFSFPKNKMLRTGVKKSRTVTLTFDPDRARFLSRTKTKPFESPVKTTAEKIFGSPSRVKNATVEDDEVPVQWRR